MRIHQHHCIVFLALSNMSLSFKCQYRFNICNYEACYVEYILNVHPGIPVRQFDHLDSHNLLEIVHEPFRPVSHGEEELANQIRRLSPDTSESIDISSLLPPPPPSTARLPIEHVSPHDGNPVWPSIMLYPAHTGIFFPFENTKQYNRVRWFYKQISRRMYKKSILKDLSVLSTAPTKQQA